jgi:hypothetical protein
MPVRVGAFRVFDDMLPAIHIDFWQEMFMDDRAKSRATTETFAFMDVVIHQIWAMGYIVGYSWC